MEGGWEEVEIDPFSFKSSRGIAASLDYIYLILILFLANFKHLTLLMEAILWRFWKIFVIIIFIRIIIHFIKIHLWKGSKKQNL